MTQQEKSPENLIQFIVMILKAYITGIPGMIKWMIISAVISGVLANAVHFYLLGWVNDGWNYGGNPWLDPIIFITGQEASPKVMLFYFMATYLFWWLIGMFRSRGIGKAVSMIASTPIWIVKSMTSIGFGIFPMIMGGLAVSFILGLILLSGPSAITMFLMMITVLISQEESLIVMGLQLGFKDVAGLVKGDEPAGVPSPHMPAVAIIGAAIGFGYMAFFNTDPIVISGIVVLCIAGLIFMFMKKRKNQNVAVYATLLFLISVTILLTPTVLADDGGIKENGGWSSLPNNTWLIKELIRRGYPATAAAVVAASWISGLFSKPVLSKVKPLGEGYVEKKYGDIHKDDKKINTWKYTKDPNGNFVDGSGQRYKRVEAKGLPEAIVDAEDSPMLGEKVRIWTQEPPADTNLQDNIVDEISELDDFYTDKLHPDNWKNLKPGQRGVVMQEINKILQKELGIEYEFKVTNNSNKGLGGSYTPAHKRKNPDGSETDIPRMIRINANGNAFDDPRTAIRTLVHEARHAYQDNQADPKGTDYQQMCKYNNKHYNGSKKDYVRYGEQFIERDSRNFGHNTTNRLINELNRKWGH
jgi:hypothetical protein